MKPHPTFFVSVQLLASLRHTYLGSFFLDPQDIKSLNLGANWNFSKGTGLPMNWYQIMGNKGPIVTA
jgi:hypothetical protein